MIEDNAGPGSTVGADKNYDTADFVAGCRERGCTPHVSQNNTHRRSAIDGRTRHAGYGISLVKRKRIEEPFGWMKTVGGLRKTRHRGRDLVEWFFVLAATAYTAPSGAVPRRARASAAEALVRIPRIQAGLDGRRLPRMAPRRPCGARRYPQDATSISPTKTLSANGPTKAWPPRHPRRWISSSRSQRRSRVIGNNPIPFWEKRGPSLNGCARGSRAMAY
jgi:hypothetical protein